MEFETFLGNETIKQRLSNALTKGQLSHCYLLSAVRSERCGKAPFGAPHCRNDAVHRCAQALRPLPAMS